MKSIRWFHGHVDANKSDAILMGKLTLCRAAFLFLVLPCSTGNKRNLKRFADENRMFPVVPPGLLIICKLFLPNGKVIACD